jgi:microcystin-dependent protein
MATVTPGYTFSSNEVVTPAKLNSAAVPTVSVANDEITTAKILNLNVTNAKLANDLDASKLTTGTLPIARIADGAVTLAKLVSTVQQALIPAGAVQAFAMNSAPSGWLEANGTEYSKTGTYAALFTAIGTSFGETNGSGGAGTSHFRVPDLRGYFVRGSGTNSDGTAAGTFGAKQADDFKSHTHTTNTSGSMNIGMAVAPGNGQPSNYNANATTGATGGTETRPKNIALLYCIKF